MASYGTCDVLRGVGVVLPCDFETYDLDVFGMRRFEAVPTESLSAHGDDRSNSLRETTRIDEYYRDDLSEIWSMGTERTTNRPSFGVPPRLQHLGQRMLGFLSLLTTGRG
ncbi:hypothetical protein PMIN07_006086 [Paraphaeosphaeria minitans]